MAGHPRRLRGIRRKRDKWQAYVSVNGTTYWRTFPRDTPVTTIQIWRRLQQATACAALPAAPPPPIIPLTSAQRDRVIAQVEAILAELATWHAYADDDIVRRFVADVRARLDAIV